MRQAAPGLGDREVCDSPRGAVACFDRGDDVQFGAGSLWVGLAETPAMDVVVYSAIPRLTGPGFRGLSRRAAVCSCRGDALGFCAGFLGPGHAETFHKDGGSKSGRLASHRSTRTCFGSWPILGELGCDFPWKENVSSVGSGRANQDN